MAISINVQPPGAIPDLNTLKSTLADWLDRDDLESRIPQFIQMAEATFNRELRSPQMVKTVIGQATTEDTPLPSDYLSMLAVYLEGSPDRPLRASSASSVRQDSDGTAGTPEAYILVGNNVRLIPPPDVEQLLNLDYYATIPPLSVFAPSNWLLERHPDLYWAATLAYAYDFVDDDAKAQKYLAYTSGVIQRINEAAKKDRYGAGPIARSTIRQTGGGRC